MNFETTYKIRVDGSSLAKPADRVRYERQVKEHLGWVHATKTGRVLLDSIRYHKLDVLVRPYAGSDCNAVGGWEPAGAGRRGVVWYSPGVFGHGGACTAARREGGRGALGDEILFHELFHAFRGVSGKFRKSAVNWQLSHYTDSEEFLAVMVANIYISDASNRNKSGLRSSHANFRPLGAGFTKGWEFFSRGNEVYGLVKKLYDENYGLFVRMANVPDTEFNPLGDFLSDRQRAEKASQAADSAAGIAKITLEMIRNL